MQQQFETVHLPNGRTAMNLCHADDSELAIVHLDVIKRLSKQLPKINFDMLRQELAEKIITCDTLPEMLAAMKDEIAFHETVNLISAIDKRVAPLIG